ncbi:SRPBCC domain-containing protein [Streptomyces sp. NRRL F-5630]|uniref:SRPBCC domain-containing protein n=1 Tax=Streptomyces sp. NRRL F-5630 TaxID=1463864 RepID=UPI003EB848A9
MQPRADTLTRDELGRSVLRLRRRLPHPARRVWAALTEAALTARWMPAEVDLSPRAACPVRFRLPGTAPGGGEVLRAVPPWALGYTWGEHELHWSLRPERAAGAADADTAPCVLHLRHVFDDHRGAASYAAGWHTCLTALAQVLDGEEPDHAGDADGALHEAYIGLLGLVGSTVDEGPESLTIRLERQLVRPADEVWSLLTRGTSPRRGERAPDGFGTVGAPAGEITELCPPRLLEHAWSPLGRTRWELLPGTGHGARLLLSHSCPPLPEPAVAAAQAAWHQRVEELAAELLDTPAPG